MNRKKNMENPAGNPAGDRKRQKRRMKDLPFSERPCEKCLKYGPEALSDGELLAVLVRSGTREYTALELACQLLDRHPVYKGLTGLYRLDRSQLKTIPGIGDVKATELLCVLEAAPVGPSGKRLFGAFKIALDVVLLILLLASIASIVSGSFNPFIYFQF